MTDLASLAGEHGTPLHVFDGALARSRAARLDAALGVHIRYAAKANRDPQVLSALQGAVAGVDVTSVGELDAAVAAGFAGDAIGISGPGKDERLLRRAVTVGARCAVGSVTEAERLAAIDPAVDALLRVNPSEVIGAFRTRTGGGATPFGVPEEELGGSLDAIRALGLRVRGIHVHRGSQCTSAAAWMRHAGAVFDLADRVARRIDGPPVVNLGGGFGVARGDMRALDVDLLGRRLRAAADAFRGAWPGATIEVEPGRWIAAPAGTLLLRVLERRHVRGTTFAVLDGGMDAFLFACAAFRHGPPFPTRNLSRAGEHEEVTLVGPACTSMDAIATVTLPAPRPGDLIAIGQAGAYAAGASISGFLGREPAPTVVI